MSYYFASIAFTLSEAIAFEIVFFALMQRRHPKRKILGSVLFVVCMMLIGWLVSFISTKVNLDASQKSLVVILVYVLVSFVFYKAPVFVRFYFTTLVYISIIAFDAIAIVALSYVDSFWGDNENLYIVCVLLFKILLIMFSIYIANNFKEKVTFIPMKMPLFASLGVMAANYFIVLKLTDSPLDNKFISVLSAASLVIFNILAYSFLDYAIRDKESSLLLQQAELQLADFTKISELYSELRSFKHDYRNQTIMLHQLLVQGNQDEALKILNEQLSTSVFTAVQYETGNFIVDAVLNTKCNAARENSIKTNVVYNDLFELAIGANDIICILTNIIDNAIEECSFVPEGQRYINIKIDIQQYQTIISVENSAGEKKQILNGFPVTTKPDKKTHGMGLKNVARVLKKYNGDFEIESNDNNFVFVAITPTAFLQ